MKNDRQLKNGIPTEPNANGFPINFGFDAKRAVYNNTGLGNYSRFVIEGLAEIFTRFKAGKAGSNPNICLLAARKRRKPTTAYLQLLERYPDIIKTVSPKRIMAKLFPALWRRYGMGRTLAESGIFLYHGLSNELPVGLRKYGIRSIVTVHDLIFLFYPQFYKPIDRYIYALKTIHACRAADRIIAVSECTKRDIVRYCDIAPEKIHVIYQGCEPRFAENPGAAALADVRRRYGLPENFLLSVGSIEVRKNLLVVVKALEILRDECPDLHLVAVGKRTPYTAAVESHAAKYGIADRVHCLHDVPNDDLQALYHAARLFVYPSVYEGFGIPIVEAIHAGLPVIAALGSCLEEAGGPACRYLIPNDAPAWAENIRQLLADPKACKHMVTESQAYVRRFNRKTATLQLFQLYQEMLADL